MAALSKEQFTSALQSILVDLLDGTMEGDPAHRTKEVTKFLGQVTDIETLGANTFAVATPGRTFVVTVSIPRA